MCILITCFRIIPWLLSDSSRSWSCGMSSVCRDPKTQCRRWLALRGCPFWGQDNLNKGFSYTTSKIWTSATCRNNSRVNCMSKSRDNVLQPNPWDPGNNPCTRSGTAGLSAFARGHTSDSLTQAGENTSFIPIHHFGTGRSTLPIESPGIGKKRKIVNKAQAHSKSTCHIP
jgi:hypothetical protein